MFDWKEISITDIDGFKLGNAENEETGTGCTAVICEKGAFAGVDVRGSAPASREHALLDPVNMVQQIHAVLLGGGSAFGLDAAAGFMQYLEEKNIGFDTGYGFVPIVCGSCLFDLAVGDGTVRPDKAMGYAACEAAGNGEFLLGNHGAGTGATVGEYIAPERAMKGGLGAYAVQVGGVKLGAVVAVNCLGTVFDVDTDKPIAGIQSEDGASVEETVPYLLKDIEAPMDMFTGRNTTIGCIITNAKLDKVQCKKVAQLTHNGYARAIRPVHTSADGDTVYCLASGELETPVLPDAVGALATEVMARAIRSAVQNAKTAYGFKAASDI